jgi:hypothetical protein
MSTEERKVIAALVKLSQSWPASLWLFAANGTLNVMQADTDGTRVMLPSQGYDPACQIIEVDIPCDGGDW